MSQLFKAEFVLADGVNGRSAVLTHWVDLLPLCMTHNVDCHTTQIGAFIAPACANLSFAKTLMVLVR